MESREKEDIGFLSSMTVNSGLFFLVSIAMTLVKNVFLGYNQGG